MCQPSVLILEQNHEILDWSDRGVVDGVRGCKMQQRDYFRAGLAEGAVSRDGGGACIMYSSLHGTDVSCRF